MPRSGGYTALRITFTAIGILAFEVAPLRIRPVPMKLTALGEIPQGREAAIASGDRFVPHRHMQPPVDHIEKA